MSVIHEDEEHGGTKIMYRRSNKIACNCKEPDLKDQLPQVYKWIQESKIETAGSSTALDSEP